MSLELKNLNRAAFFLSLGAKLIEVRNRYPNNTFFVNVPRWLFVYERIGLVPYKKFSNKRIDLKRKGRRLAGLPERFTGDNSGFELGEMPVVRSFTDRDIAQYNNKHT